MRIGTDGSLNTCKEEGYLMMEFKVRELFSKKVFQPDALCRFIAHYPDYVLKDIHGTENPVGQKTLIVDALYSANDLWECYQLKAEGIDSFTGMEGREFPTCEYTLLQLADDVNSYSGIE